MAPRVFILRAPGTNCDQETAFAFASAGGQPERLHLNRLLENPQAGRRTIKSSASPAASATATTSPPAAFSATRCATTWRMPGRVQRRRQADPRHLQRLSDPDQDGAAPAERRRPARSPRSTAQRSGKFEDRWVHLASQRTSACFPRHRSKCTCPSPTREGKFVARDEKVLASFRESGQLVLAVLLLSTLNSQPSTLKPPSPTPPTPTAPCRHRRRLRRHRPRLRLMPHPERHIDPTQHPRWTREPQARSRRRPPRV